VATIETNAAEVAGLLGRLFRDQVPFALSVAINDTAKAAQEVQRRHQRQVFDVRNTRFVDSGVKLKPFATKRRPEAALRVEPLGGRERASILTRHEDQREKRAREGRNVAVPSPYLAGRRRRRGVPVKLRPGALGLQPVTPTMARGQERTFRVNLSAGPLSGLILQRTGRGKRSRTRVLYFLRPLVRIRPELDFVPNIRNTVDREFQGFMARAFDHAVRTAR